MASQDPADRPTTTDQILDLLLDALLERNAARRGQSYSRVPPPEPPARPPAAEQAPAPAESVTTPARAGAPDLHTPPAPQVTPDAVPRPTPAPARPPVAAMNRPVEPPRSAALDEPRPGEPGWQLPERQPSINLGKTIGRLAILVMVLAVLINIPIDRYGVSLARVMPDSASLIIRDGLVLMGSGPEIYRLEDNKLRWISSMDAFEHLGLTWGDVHVVEDSFLTQFEMGRPIHVVLKCDGSPHIYRLENDQKRWIADIATFEAEGHVWDDVRFVSCQYLRDLPDGPPIPEDAGEPPQP